MFKKLMILLVLVVVISGCVEEDNYGGEDKIPAEDTTPETRQLNDDLSNVDSVDDVVGTEDLDNIDIDMSLLG
ncbi:MAG: hypothetical protein KAI53_04790 [Candidatus Aenigmarchaeota archaeon]|nr:hypothetical protein [Candidatus Aenigmarchaeota archaeon]